MSPEDEATWNLGIGSSIVMGAILFGLVVGTLVFYEIAQLKGGLILSQGIFIENQGNGNFSLISPIEGMGILNTNLPLGLALPVGECYQVMINQSSRPIRILIRVNPVSSEKCGGANILGNSTVQPTTNTSQTNQSVYYYRDGQGLHVMYHHNPISLNATLLPEIPVDSCYVLTISLNSSGNQVDVQTKPIEQSYCGLP